MLQWCHIVTRLHWILTQSLDVLSYKPRVWHILLINLQATQQRWWSLHARCLLALIPLKKFRSSRCICSFLLCHLLNHFKILHIPRQHGCLGMCKIVLWLNQPYLNYGAHRFYHIWNLIKLLWVGQAPGLLYVAIFQGMYDIKNSGLFFPCTADDTTHIDFLDSSQPPGQYSKYIVDKNFRSIFINMNIRILGGKLNRCYSVESCSSCIMLAFLSVMINTILCLFANISHFLVCSLEIQCFSTIGG